MSNEFVARKGLISLQTSSFKEDVYVSGSVYIGTYDTSSRFTVSGSGYISKGLIVDGGITGSLYGTSSWAVSASWAPNAGTSSYTLGNVSASYIDFSQTPDLPSVVGRLQWSSDLGTLKYGLPGGNVTAELGMDVLAYVYNAEATTLSKGEAVYISGSITDRIAVKRASALSDATSAKTLGLVAESIPSGDTGYVVNRGYLLDIDTSGYSAGDTLYLSGSAGQFTTVKPKAPVHLVYLGVVVKVGGGSSGRIYVFTQNGYELDEIHDVRINGKTSGDLLVYSSSGLWENTKTLPGQYTITGGITGSLSGTSSYALTASYIDGGFY
jgi:hypothetical protein